MIMKIPKHLSHKPIIAVDYGERDGSDAKFLSIGRATWGNHQDFSIKVWRYLDKTKRWSRQSEELPLWRLLDLTILLVGTITKQQTSLKEEVIPNSNSQKLMEQLHNDKELLERMKELKGLLNTTNVI